MTATTAKAGGAGQWPRRTGLLLLELGLAPWGAPQTALMARLPASERARIERYRRDDDRTRALAAALLPRLLIARRTGRALSAIELARTPAGKPFYAPDPGLQFNLSHAGACVALAVGPSAVGVDVEQVRLGRDLEGIARRFFAPEEQRWLARFDASERPQRFFELWSRKESLLKATGEGLAGSLASFSAVIIGSDELTLEFRGWRWRLRSYHELPGYSLALCARSAPPLRPVRVSAPIDALIEGTSAAIDELVQVALGPVAP
jgi:4'-phosphopantetheinyl transferase